MAESDHVTKTGFRLDIIIDSHYIKQKKRLIPLKHQNIQIYKVVLSSVFTGNGDETVNA